MSYLHPSVGGLLGGHAPAAAVANVPARTSAPAAGSTPTKAEHDAVVADVAAMATVVNALLASLRAGNVVASA